MSLASFADSSRPGLRLCQQHQKRLTAQFVEQRLGLFQIGGIETFGEPVVDLGEHRVRLATTSFAVEQVCEAHRGAQLPCFRTHAASHRDRFAEVGFSQLPIPLLKPQFAANPESLRTAKEFLGIKVEGPLDRFKPLFDRAR